MNNPHKGARLTVYSREQIVARIQAGTKSAEVAAAFGVSLRTVRKWLARFRAGGQAALSNRASAPARVARRLPDRLVALALHLRRSLRLTGAEIARKLGLARSTVARWLARAGMGRLARLDPPEPVRRYQRARPGELIHLDIKKLGRFDRPGHRVTGTRRGCRNRGAGWDFVHVAVDDTTRLAYVEVLGDERRDTTTAFLLRALRWFRARGIRAERVMTDNGSRPFNYLGCIDCRGRLCSLPVLAEERRDALEDQY
ncbi:MAG: IS481 family transposase [Rhodobacteraceae bacterium PARR1]|jgi:transposase|nr:MAG: IS481 family transposase [Rhodobacteraceae bacterium PARR1]